MVPMFWMALKRLSVVPVGWLKYSCQFVTDWRPAIV